MKEEKKKQLTINLILSTYNRINKDAKKNYRSVNAEVSRVLDSYYMYIDYCKLNNLKTSNYLSLKAYIEQLKTKGEQ